VKNFSNTQWFVSTNTCVILRILPENLLAEKIEKSLPSRCAISKRLRYEEQIKALHLFRLLSLEMLHRRVEIE